MLREVDTMSDIFVSYAREDRARVSPLVEALRETGWDIFWDTTILPGTDYRQKIYAEIQACRCMLVVWSQKSVKKGWVLDEAEIGKRKEILVPVLLDEVEPPLGFGAIQAAKLVQWCNLIAAIENILGRAPVRPHKPEFSPPSNWDQLTAKIFDVLILVITKSSALFRRIVGTIFASFVITAIIIVGWEAATGRYFTGAEVFAIGLMVLVTVLAIPTILSWLKRRGNSGSD